MPVSFGGSGLPLDNHEPTQAVTYLINTGGVFPTDPSPGIDILGSIVPFAGNFAPDGYHIADGSLLPIAGHTALFSLLGTLYGGDGTTDFALPDLRGRDIVGASGTAPVGSQVGQENTTVTAANLPASAGGSGQAIDNQAPGLAMNYIISTSGIFPSNGGGSPSFNTQYVGEVIAFASVAAAIPNGWALCDGSLLSVASNPVLFDVLGTTYGGDGVNNFALPDLRNKVVIGTGSNDVIGNQVGVNAITLTTANIIDAVPQLSNVGPSVAATEQVIVVLDTNIQVSDANLGALNGGLGNYTGASLTLARHGGANSEDTFSFDATGATFTISSGNLQSGGLTFATFTNAGGTLTINFVNTGTLPTTALVQNVLQHIAYEDTSDNPPASVQLDYLFSDGNSGAQGTPSSPATDTQSLTVNITAVDDPAIAQNDAFTIAANAVLGSGLSLFNDNGSGPDHDPDGPALTVASVNGVAGNVGHQFTLPSGALLTVNADGSFSYDPNHAFDTLAAPGSGAADTTATDSFSYTLGDGGASATVTLTIDGVDNASTIYDGTGGNDTITGGSPGALYDLSQGGNDTVTGGAGNDGFFFGGAYTPADHVDGGAGSNNQIGLHGNYSGGMTLSGSSIVNIQVLAMQPGFNYNFTTTDDLVPTGQTFSFWSVSMTSANHVILDGSAESDGRFNFYLGQGNDTATGGAGNDLFYGEGGADTLRGNGGADTFAYLAVSDSTGASFDTIQDFTAGTDKFKLPAGDTVTGIDATVASGTLTTATFDADLAAAIGAGQLLPHHAVLFTPTTTDYPGHTFLIVDANGTAGYQAGQDFVFDVTGGSLAGLSTGDFT
jgi:VCBS repeat-containing protein